MNTAKPTDPPEPSGYGSVVHKSSTTEDGAALAAITRWRRHAGYGLGMIASALMLLLIVYALWTLRCLLNSPPPVVSDFTFAILGAETIIAVAGVWFLYQMLRVAERLAIPSWWLEEHVESARLVLGVKDPGTAALESAEKVLELVKKSADIVKR